MIKKTTIVLLSMILGMLHGAALQESKASEAFSDVPEHHWAYETIYWGASEGAVTGYPDGTFRPTQQVTEAEFLTMFIRTFDELPTPSNLRHWADPAYNYALDRNWPVLGVDPSSASRNTAVTRETVANIIAGANGINLIGVDAIQYLLNQNFAQGKTGEKTVDGYKGEDFLTRAEAIQFIKNVKDAGLSELKERPTLPGQKPTTPPTDVPEEIANMVAAMEDIIANNPAYSGFKTGYSNTNVAVRDGDTSLVSFKIDEYSESDAVLVFKATNPTVIDLTLDMLEAAGVTLNDEIRNAIREAPTLLEAKDTRIITDDYQVTVRPHAISSDRMTIHFKKL